MPSKLNLRYRRERTRELETIHPRIFERDPTLHGCGNNQHEQASEITKWKLKCEITLKNIKLYIHVKHEI